jgi:sphinganine C4-monooxygenase
LLTKQALQTLLGLVLSAFGEDDPYVIGSEEYELAIWIGRVRVVRESLPVLLSFTGIDFRHTTSTLGGFLPAVSMSSIDVAIGTLLHRYIMPFSSIILALIVADASMYCLHRLGHTNKWIYSKPKTINGTGKQDGN